MRKRWTFWGIVLSLLILFIGFILADADITGQTITGEAVTGKALQSSLALNITVTLPIPVITIMSPKNGTYLTNESILINYSSVNTDNIWYNFDLESNVTLNGPIYINISQGQHTLYIYGNNSYGESTMKIVNFITNSTFFTILYNEYNGITRGNSTNFNLYTYEDLQNLDNLVLENSNYGKIKFDEIINVTNDKINNDNLVDLDSNIDISFNKIELNSETLPNFNTSAVLSLYNLSFSNPRILKNGLVCPATECIKESYTYPSSNGGDGVLRFYVTGFSTYSLEETPYTSLPYSGGGGSSSSEVYDYTPVIDLVEDNITLISDEIKVSLNPGETIFQDFYLMNAYDGIVEADISFVGIENFVSVSETNIILPYQEIKALKLNFSIPKDTPPDNYVGKILVKSNGVIYESVISIDVQSVESLFDVRLEMDEEKLPANPGSYIWFKTLIYNLGGDEDVEAYLEYSIKDSSGGVIFEGEDLVLVGDYLEKEGKIKLPRDISDGKYVLSTKIGYEGKTAVTSVSFDIQRRKLPKIWKILIPILVIFLLLFILWFIGKKDEKKRKREQEKKHESLNY